MNEEAKRILKMVEEGKISADKATDLMEAFESMSSSNGSTKNYEDKFLRVKVLSSEGDKVNIQLPIKVIKAVLNVTGKLPVDTMNIKGVNTEELIETIVSCLDSEVMGEIVSVDSAEGDIVRIVIE